MKGFTEGRIVHFVLPNGEHRPAMIVLAWPDGTGCEGYANLQVFIDGMNDANNVHLGEENQSAIWRPSVCFDDQEKKTGTWHWIEPA